MDGIYQQDPYLAQKNPQVVYYHTQSCEQPKESFVGYFILAYLVYVRQ